MTHQINQPLYSVNVISFDDSNQQAQISRYQCSDDKLLQPIVFPDGKQLRCVPLVP